MKPEVKCPKWFHPDGLNMALVQGAPESTRVKLMSTYTGASCSIKQKYSRSVVNAKDFPWRIVCKMPGRQGGQTKIEIYVTTEQLRQMFCREGALRQCYSDGLFYRERELLSLPGKGTGVKGDPNLSIYITTAIMEAVAALITHYAPKQKGVTTVMVG